MLALSSAVVLMFGSATTPLTAQLAVPPLAPADYQPLSDQQLDQLLGPIALYPDPLLAELLPAATFPTDLVLANRYVTGGGDPSAIQYQPWDPSVQAIAHYPAVLQYLDVNLSWTVAVGKAFSYQQQQVMESIQRLRLSAQNFGNLYSTPQQDVVTDDGYVEILPADPDIIYVPVYQPDVVYVESGCSLVFAAGWTFGPWLDGDFDWGQGNLCFWRHHHRPANWWHSTRTERATALASGTSIWRPGNSHGASGASLGNHGGNNASGQSSEPRNNNFAPVPRPTDGLRPSTSPRPTRSPMPAANPITDTPRASEPAHNYGGYQMPDHPAPAVTYRGPSGGGSSASTRTFTEPNHDNAPAITRNEPAHVEPPRAEQPRVEPPRVEPPHVEPPHVEPPHVEPAHSPEPAPSSQNDNGSHGSSHR